LLQNLDDASTVARSKHLFQHRDALFQHLDLSVPFRHILLAVHPLLEFLPAEARRKRIRKRAVRACLAPVIPARRKPPPFLCLLPFRENLHDIDRLSLAGETRVLEHP